MQNIQSPTKGENPAAVHPTPHEGQGAALSSPLITIVTPVFNSGRFLRHTIAAVQAQTYSHWEMLLIDDCSTDDTCDIIRSFHDDHRIHLLKLDHNSGAAVARNTGIRQARGEYLAFLDSDDIWKPDKLQKQLTFMQKGGYSFSFTSLQMVDEEGNPKKTITVPPRADYRYLLQHTVIATSTVMLHMPDIGTFQMPLRRGGQDYATWLMLLRRTEAAYGIAEPLTQYRLCAGSLSSNKLQSVKQVFQIQTQGEHIGKLRAAVNTLAFCFYAFKKHYL